jgi:hypothetical protein
MCVITLSMTAVIDTQLYILSTVVEKSLQLNKGNMVKSPMSHIAPIA